MSVETKRSSIIWMRIRIWIRQNLLCDHYSVHMARTHYKDGRVFACIRCSVCGKKMSPGVEFGNTEAPSV